MTIGQDPRLVKGMRLTDKQINRLASIILKKLVEQKQMTYKESEAKVLHRAIEIIKSNFEQEKQLDREVNKMMDDLERENPGSFQRYKMFPLLKKRLAKKKGVIL